MGSDSNKKLRRLWHTHVDDTMNENLAKHMYQPSRSLQPPNFSGAFPQTALGLPALT